MKRSPSGAIMFPFFGFRPGDDYPLIGIHETPHRALEEPGLPHLDLCPWMNG